jgi:hypothetical protein
MPHNNPTHHLRPSNAYNNNSTTGSSSSTPNLTQMQLSPNPSVPKSTSPQINSRFPFTNGQRPTKTDSGHFMTASFAPPQHYNYQRPPLSAPPAANYNNKPISPYHSPMIPNQQHARMNNGNGYYHSQNQIAPIYRNGMIDKYSQWQQQQQQHSPNMQGQMQVPIASKSVSLNF